MFDAFDVQDAKAAVESAASVPPSYDPASHRQQRLASLLMRACDEIVRLRNGMKPLPPAENDDMHAETPAVVRVILNTIHMHGRLTPDIERDLTDAMDGLLLKVDRDVSRVIYDRLKNLEPHWFPGDVSPLQVGKATILAALSDITALYGHSDPEYVAQGQGIQAIGAELKAAAESDQFHTATHGSEAIDAGTIPKEE